MLNQINLPALQAYADTVAQEAAAGKVDYRIRLDWTGGPRSVVHAQNMQIGGQDIQRNYQFAVDEPTELLGTDSAPSPQDYLLGGMAACMAFTFVLQASQRGIKLEALELVVSGSLDLRGMLGLDATVPVGFNRLAYQFKVKSEASQAALDEVAHAVREFSPNFATMTNAVELLAETVVKH